MWGGGQGHGERKQTRAGECREMEEGNKINWKKKKKKKVERKKEKKLKLEELTWRYWWLWPKLQQKKLLHTWNI